LLAINLHNKTAIKILLEAGADINKKGQPDNVAGTHTPLSYAIYCGFSEIIELLMKNGARL
jgi:ankyrin repeat protein